MNLKPSNAQYTINKVNRQVTYLGENSSNLENRVSITRKVAQHTDNQGIKHKRKMRKDLKNQFTELLCMAKKCTGKKPKLISNQGNEN